jgi:hypothetical protein
MHGRVEMGIETKRVIGVSAGVEVETAVGEFELERKIGEFL